MAIYYLNLHECGVITRDPEGADYPDVAAARAGAYLAARSIMCAEIAEGRLCLSCHIEIVDRAERPVLIVPFREAVAVSGLDSR